MWDLARITGMNLLGKPLKDLNTLPVSGVTAGNACSLGKRVLAHHLSR